MTSVALQVSDMLNTLEKEDYDLVISYIQFLSDKRQKEHEISMERGNSGTNGIKLGLFNGMKYIADGHDIDECNDEIAELFGVNG